MLTVCLTSFTPGLRVFQVFVHTACLWRQTGWKKTWVSKRRTHADVWRTRNRNTEAMFERGASLLRGDSANQPGCHILLKSRLNKFYVALRTWEDIHRSRESNQHARRQSLLFQLNLLVLTETTLFSASGLVSTAVTCQNE